jgi:long-chain acyl-CoA synthetase
VLDLLQAGLERDPSRSCVVQDARCYSFAEVADRAARAVTALIELGVEPGDRVALLARNQPEFFELQIACQRLGAVLVPLNFRLAAAELATIIGDAEPALLVVDDNLDGVVDLLGAPRCVRLGPEWEDALGAVEPAPVPDALDGDRVVQILFTSGTTGRPKGVCVSGRALAARMTAYDAGSRAESDAVFLQVAPLFHLAGTLSLSILRAGGTHIAMREFDPHRWLAAVREHGVSVSFLVPTMLDAVATACDDDQAGLESLRLLMYGASPITPDLFARVRRVLGCGFAQMYGMTETGAATLLAPEDHDDARADVLRSAGRPLAGFHVEVRRPGGMACAAGETGEICIASEAVMDGYWRREDETRATLFEGLVRTGDAGYLDAAGYVFVTDRIKDMIITGGENVYAREVELAVLAHPAVADVAVIGVPDERWGQRVHAVVVPVAGVEPRIDELDRACRERIAPYKRPRSYSTQPSLPRNAMGKVLKGELRDAVQHPQAGAPSANQPVG